MKNGKVVETSLNDGSDNEFEVTINNVEKQFDLPQTGGDGILLFTIAGGILMAAAIILFAAMRKKKA
jgi:LPXTG-motif cell wall-anchored protein